MSATAPSQTVFSIGYDFHVGNGTTGTDNGNVWGITNYRDATRNQTFTYDELNRLTSAQNAGSDCAVNVLGGKKKFWGNSYGYDAWGNLLSKTVTKCSAESLSVVAGTNNRLGGAYLYDAAGNMTHDATSGLNYTFDQENRLTGANGYTYTYDGDGNRVRKSNGNLAASGTLYWEMTPGVVAETDLAGTLKSEYVFFDGERVSRRDGPTGAGGVFYYFSDHLKTASVITDSVGVIKAESDYYPWGGELQFVNNDSNDYKFTGKKRDAETGLDYFGARYYSNGLGRWVSADWSATPVPVPYADFHDPQTLNLYGFVGGNPASKADTDGHCPWCLALAGGGTLAGAGGVALVSNPVGWTILGVAAVGAIGYVVYEHYHKDSSPPPLTTTNPGTSTTVPGTTTTTTQTGTPASTSQAGVVDSSPAQATKAAPGTRPGQPFTKAGKREIDSANATAKGQTKCVGCNNDVKSQANKKDSRLQPINCKGIIRPQGARMVAAPRKMVKYVVLLVTRMCTRLAHRTARHQ